MPHHPDDKLYPHLPLIREGRETPRRKNPSQPPRGVDRGGRVAFGSALKDAIGRLEEEARLKPSLADGVHPHLVFRIPLAPGSSSVGLTDLLQGHGLTVVSVESDGAVVAFRNDRDLAQFKNAVDQYQRGPAQGLNPQTGKPYQSTKFDVFEVIEAGQMRLWGRVDRVGLRLAKRIGDGGERIDLQALYVLDVDLWHPGGHVHALGSISELRKLVEGERKAGEKLSDSFVGDMLCLARVTVTGGKLDRLLEMDSVAEVELPPQPSFDNHVASLRTPRDFPSPPMPRADGPRVCILDSGIASSHKLLSNNVGHEEAILTTLSSPSDGHGHGTMVGGIAVFGDVRARYETGDFSSPITLFSARVLNDRNEFDDDKLIYTQMRESIKLFSSEPHNCRVFNLSLGSHEPLLTGTNKKQGPWAESLDLIARELKVLLVVSAGNHDTPVARDTAGAESALAGYPDYLFEPQAGICDPATAAIAITVGALAERDAPEVRRGVGSEDLVRSIAKAGEPTPSTRIGPGVGGALKPEFVSYGGTGAFQGHGQYRNTERLDPGLAVMSFSHEPARRLFAHGVGTSFAAPRVANLAALVWDRIRRDFGEDPHPNLVRAVLGTAAERPAATCSLVESKKGLDHIPHVCGYGIPDPSLALESGDRRVTLVAQSRIKLDTFQIFQIPVPSEFQEDRGKKKILVSLAFDPPVRRRRAQYLGVDMCCYLIRNKSIDEIIAAYRAVTAVERRSNQVPAALSGSCKCEFDPTPTSLVTSTLHRYQWVSQRKLNDSETFYLVVRAERNWAPAEITEQDFGVAVTLESNDPLLYASVRQRIPLRQRSRLRQ